MSSRPGTYRVVKRLLGLANKGRLVPAASSAPTKVQDHAFFGMRKKDRTPVPEVMEALRGGRYRDL